jgi:hypothetical protein
MNCKLSSKYRATLAPLLLNYGPGRGLSSIGAVSIKRFDTIIDLVVAAYFLKCGDSIWLRYAESLA